MADITLRLVKGTPLTNSEVDNNFSNLNITKTEIGGDLGGNVFYPTVIGIQGRAVANTAPANLQVLSWSETANTWTPSNAASNYGELQTKPGVNVIITGDLTGSSNVVLLNTDTNVISVNVSYDFDNIDSRYLKLDNPTTQYVTSYVNFQGNVVFGGNVTTIGANNLIITDNFIYLNDGFQNTNVDFGFVGNYNDGTYAHAGFFRDASDNGTWKIFEGYLPEPDAAVNIDTDNVSFRLANLAVNTITANSLQGITNTALVTNLNADLLDSQQGTYYTNYANQTNKPDANVTLTGLVTGSANILLEANTNVLTIVTASNPSANATFYNLDTSNAVITSSVYATNIYSSGFHVWTANNDGAGSGLDADLLDGQDGVYYTDYVNQIHKPFANVVITGNITGSGNAVLNANTNIITVTAAVADNSVTLGTHTVGNYIANVVQGTAIEVSGGGTEGAVATVSHADTSTLSGLQGGAGIASITVDGLGHVTAVSSATYLSQPGLNLVFTGDVTGSSNLTLSNSTTNLLSVALTVEPNSVALGTDTTGNYTNRVVGGTGVSATGTADEGNVITVGLTNTGVSAATYGNATIVPVITVDAQGRLTSAANVSIAFPVASNVFSYAGACRNTITQTCSTHAQLTSTGFNFFAGACTGNSITTGENNVFLGECAGKSMTEGSNNFFVGRCAGHFSQQSYHNTFIGIYAGKCTTVGNYNNFLGRGTGTYNTTGRHNNFFGSYAGGANTVGQHNNFFGSEAGYYNKTGISNNYFGRKAGYNNACGSYNNIFGHYAGYYNTTGSYNNFIGCYAGRYNTTGCFNNFIGPAAGRSNTTGSRNNFIGCRAGYCNTIGVDNVFVGTCSGHNTTSGSNNVFAGRCAGFCNTTGCRNVYLGPNSGGNVLTGNDNIIFGCITANVGLTASTSNVFVVATGGVTRVINDGALGNTTVTGNVIANAFFGNGSRLTGVLYNQLTNPPAANIVLTGDVTGSANAILTANSTILSISTTVAANSVALGTDTTGNYTDRVVNGGNITVTGTADEGNVITVSIPQSVATTATMQFGNVYILGSSSNDANVLILRNGSGTTNSAAVLGFEASSGALGDPASLAAQIKGIRTGSGTSGALAFSVANGGVLGEKIRIHTSGQIVIGSTPSVPYATSTVPLYVKGGTSGWSVFERNGKALFLNPNYSDLNTHAQLSSQAADNMALSLSARETSADLYLTTTGNVGVGTTTPLDKLDVVSGTTVYRNRIRNSSGSEAFLLFQNSDTGTTTTDGLIVGIGGNEDAYLWNHENSNILIGTNNLERVRVTLTGNVGIGTTTPAYKLEVNGSFAATTKSFVIDHPSKPDHRLVHGSLEGPENGVYVRGKLNGSDTIVLPDYWKDLIDEDTITVNLTPIGKHQKLYVEEVSNTTITVGQGGLGLQPINCYYTVFAERKDVPKLVVEVKK